MEARITQISSLAQKERGPAYTALVNDIFSAPDQSRISSDLRLLLHATVENQDGWGLVAGRQVAAEIVRVLGQGAVQDHDLRKSIVQDLIGVLQPRSVSYEEQINLLRYQLADLLETEEDWSGAARVLMGVSLDSAQRTGTEDADKLRLYVRIIRLLLEDEDSVQAETYYNRAALLAPSTKDQEIQLQFKLCQARISDYSRKFLEAARWYHELSWVADIDEEERLHMLAAAVTCAVLAPAGPNRSRVLASLYRDERAAQLPTYNILSKIFLDQILRAAEVSQFEATLKPHQLAKITISSNDRLASSAAAGDDAENSNDGDDDGANGDAAMPRSTRTAPSTVLDRAVLEHNLLASSKIYKNITFRGLGTLLDLTPGAAETMARKMIEQGRLRASIDQVDRLIWFEDVKEEDNAQGKAGGLGDVEQEEEDTGAPFTKRWDAQIRLTAANVESIVEHLNERGLLNTTPTATATMS